MSWPSFEEPMSLARLFEEVLRGGIWRSGENSECKLKISMKASMWWGFSATDSWMLPMDPAKNTEEKNTYQVRSTDVVHAEDLWA